MSVQQPFRKESQFQFSVHQLFESCNWFLYHETDSRRSREGMLDCHGAVHRMTGDIVFAELKMPRRNPSWGQIRTLEALSIQYASCTYLWLPEDWSSGIIELVAKRKPSPKTAVAEWRLRRERYDFEKIRQQWERDQARKRVKRSRKRYLDRLLRAEENDRFIKGY